MSLVLTHAYYISDDPKEQKIMKPYPPLGLLYISGYLNEVGIENYVFDTTFYQQQTQLQFIEEKQPEVVAIYTNLMTKVEVPWTSFGGVTNDAWTTDFDQGSIVFMARSTMDSRSRARS